MIPFFKDYFIDYEKKKKLKIKDIQINNLQK